MSDLLDIALLLMLALGMWGAMFWLMQKREDEVWAACNDRVEALKPELAIDRCELSPHSWPTPDGGRLYVVVCPRGEEP